ncbi:MAG: selenium metabolism-associated LysR family transcriptional regulator [Desulfobacterales bacterium]
MDFGLRELEIFCKVVELSSFSKAAEAVHLAQATVSERIATLERKMTVQLLDRLGRKVVPTAAGELLHKHATLLLEMKETSRLEMERFLGREQGEVSMGGSTIPGEYILPRCISQFHAEYPRLSIKLAVADSRSIEKGVLKGTYEIGVIGFKGRHPNLLCQPLWRDELVLAVAGDHLWAQRETITLAELCGAPWILRERGSGTLKMLESYLRQNGIPGTDGFEVRACLGSSTAVKEGIKAGLGISVLSKRAIDTELGAGVLAAVEVEGLAMSRSFYLIRNKLRAASPACQAMHRFLLASARKEMS